VTLLWGCCGWVEIACDLVCTGRKTLLQKENCDDESDSVWDELEGSRKNLND